MVAIDDDNNGIDPITGNGASTVQLPDAVTYELSGADAGYFDIVQATGQILTVKKLDYEDKKEFKVTVKAEDVAGLSDTIIMTINVLDVDEVPVPDVLRITGVSETGGSKHDYEENSTDPVGEYKVAAGGEATPGAWTLEGADASSFRLTGSGTTRMLEFRSSPDYDAEADANSDNNYEVTIKVTDSSNSDTYDTFAVTVTVINVEELGVLSGSKTASVNEGDTDVPGTYELTEIEDGPAVTWSVDGTDMSQFTLVGTGMSRDLTFSSAPDFENPMGGAADDSNTYMVTVMAEAGGQTDMVEVTITVDNVDELGTLTADMDSPISYMENGTMTVATYTADGPMADNAMWTKMGADADYFTIMDGMLKFSSAPDYEMPRSAAMSATNTNTYMVTVMASAGGEMEMVAVTITVDNVKEAGAVTLNPTRPSVGTPITASLEDSDIVEGTVSWQWAKSMTMDGDFEDITGADSDTYTPAAADAGMYLMATATYTDGLGSDSANMVSSAAVSQLAVNGDPEVEHPENVTSVATYTASGAASVQWSLLGDDARDFNINGGQLTFRTLPGLRGPGRRQHRQRLHGHGGGQGRHPHGQSGCHGHRLQRERGRNGNPVDHVPGGWQ